MSIQTRVSDEVKAAMRARDKARLGALRLIAAAIKQVEVDTRRALDDADVLGVLHRMLKQRRDAETQYREAGREDLAEQERFEIEVIEGFMPAALGEAELEAAVSEAINEAGATSMKDMGAVMTRLKTTLAGRADMGAVSALVKARLSRSG